MRSFREFLLENTVIGGMFNFPNISDIRDPNLPPVGGYTSFAQRAQYRIEKDKMSGPHKKLFDTQKVLEQFAYLAEQAAASMKIQNNYQSHSDRDTYSSAKWADNAKTIIQLSEQDIIRGRSPQIRQVDFDWGIQQQIFSPSDDEGKPVFLLNTNVLKQKMLELREQIKVVSREYEKQIYRAGIYDQGWNNAGNVLKRVLYGPSQLKVIGT